MIIEVKVPSVGESVTSGVVSTWHKKSGEFVNEGEPLFALETDKVSTDIVAEKSGVIETKVPEGQEVKIGEVVAVIDDSKQTSEQDREEKPKKKEPEAKKEGQEQPVAAGVDGGRSTVAAKEERAQPASSPRATALSPGVRRIVEEEKLDLEKITGTGQGGRLTKADVLKAVENRSRAKPSDVVMAKAKEEIEPREVQPSGEARFVRKKMSPLRRKIAQQLVMAQHTAAILTTFNECDMSTVQELRRSKQDEFTKKHGVKLGLMSFFVKAAVEALKAVPVVNGRIDDDDFIQNKFYDIGVAVGTERGLVVPVVRDADKKSFADLERDIAGYAERAREGKLKLEDLQGGTFTITNGGVYGSLFATPILNPPQSGILGMHKIMPRPMAVDGKVEIRPMMYLALSYDHRAIDGKEAVTFLIKVKECIEDPKNFRLDF
ncbi:MAG TPA: 2-oxoglutarate dehydrogenase complex dihydrolipoyllysine-residue succinyltransferase [Candidatus Udaeobacter sp.]|nr:2-oxoglutarate dehydrogenase complex dihydrolipoyllysine-residue succinyltransferase [Candidatus Udaeobacter sp.]